MHFGEFNPLDVLATAASLQSGGNQAGGNTSSSGEPGDDSPGDAEAGDGGDGSDDVKAKDIPSYFTVSDHSAESTNNNKTANVDISTITPQTIDNKGVVLINNSANLALCSPSGSNVTLNKMVTGKINARQIISMVPAGGTTSSSSSRTSSAGESAKTTSTPGTSCVVKVLNGDNFSKVPQPISNKDATTKFVYAGKDGNPKTLTVVRINRGGQIADHSYAIFSQLEKQRSEDDEGYCSRSSLDSPGQSFRCDAEIMEHDVFESKDGRATPKSPVGKVGPRSPLAKRSMLASPQTVLVTPKAGSSAAAARMASNTISVAPKCLPIVEAASSNDQANSVLGKKPAKIVIVSRDASLRKLFGSSETSKECSASPGSPTSIVSPTTAVSTISIETNSSLLKMTPTSSSPNLVDLTTSFENSEGHDMGSTKASRKNCEDSKSTLLMNLGSDALNCNPKAGLMKLGSCSMSVTKCDSGVSLCDHADDDGGRSTEICDDHPDTDIVENLLVTKTDVKSNSFLSIVCSDQSDQDAELKNESTRTATDSNGEEGTPETVDEDYIDVELSQTPRQTFLDVCGEEKTVDILATSTCEESSKLESYLSTSQVSSSKADCSNPCAEANSTVLHEMLSNNDGAPPQNSDDLEVTEKHLHNDIAENVHIKSADAYKSPSTSPPVVSTSSASFDLSGNLIVTSDKLPSGFTSGAHKYIIEDDVSPVTKFSGGPIVLACSPLSTSLVPGPVSISVNKETLAPVSSSQLLPTVSSATVDSATMPRLLLSSSPAVWKMQAPTSVGGAATSVTKPSAGNVNICLASQGNVGLFQQMVPSTGSRQSMITLPLCSIDKSKGVNLSAITPKSVGLLALPNRTLVSSQSAFTPLVPPAATSSPTLILSPATPQMNAAASSDVDPAAESPVDALSTSPEENKKNSTVFPHNAGRRTPVTEGRLTPIGPSLVNSEGMSGKINIKISGGVVVDVSPSEDHKDTQRKTAASIGQLGSLTLQSMPSISPVKPPSSLVTSSPSITMSTSVQTKQRKMKALGSIEGGIYGSRSCHAYTKRRQKLSSMGLSQLELSRVKESALTVSRLHPLIDHDYCEFSEFSAEIQSSIIATTATKLKIDQGKGLKKTKAARTKAVRNIPIEINLDKLRKKRKYTRRKPLLKHARGGLDQDLLEPMEKKIKLEEGDSAREEKFSIVQSKRQKLREKKPKRHYTPRYSTDKNYVKITGSYQDEFVYFATKKSTRGRQRKVQDGAADSAAALAARPATVGGIGVFDYYQEMSKVDKTKFKHVTSAMASGVKPLNSLQDIEVVDMVMDMMHAETIVIKKEESSAIKEEIGLDGEIEIKPTPLGHHEGDGDILPMLDEFLSSLNDSERMNFQQNLSTIDTNETQEIKSESSEPLETNDTDKSEDGSRKPSPTSVSLVEETTAPGDLSAYLNYDEESNHVEEPVLPQVVPASHYLDLDEIEASVDLTGMSIGNYLDPTMDMKSGVKSGTASTPVNYASFDRPLDKSELFPDLSQPPTTVPSNELSGAPELTTVTMYWNDLPGLLIQSKQYVRLVDIHKQVLPAKDTGILKKRCQMMGLEIRNCSELQRDFLIRYMNAAKSKSTVIVSKEKAQVLIGFYVDPRPRVSVSRNSSANDLAQLERASSAEPDYEEGDKPAAIHKDEKPASVFRPAKPHRTQSIIHRFHPKKTAVSRHPASHPVSRHPVLLSTDDNVKRSARLKDKKVQYAAMLHGGWIDGEDSETPRIPVNTSASKEGEMTPVRGKNGGKNGRLVTNLKKKLILEDNPERAFVAFDVVKALQARAQQPHVGGSMDKVRKLPAGPDELELRKLITKQKHKKLNKKDKLRIIKLRERIRKKQKQVSKVTGLSAQLTERHLAERKKKWLANLEKARQKQREKREANKSSLSHEHCYATSGLSREGVVPHGEVIMPKLMGADEHALLTSKENMHVVTVEHPLVLNAEPDVEQPQVKNGMETPPPTPKPSPKVIIAEEHIKRQPLAVVHRDLVHRSNHRGRTQAGDLHLSLYKTKDSQCIQCVKCTDFFNVTRFLKHMHHFSHIDELLEVTLPQKLELNSESPTPPELLVWDEFKQRRQDFIKNNRNARKRAESRRKAASISRTPVSEGSNEKNGKTVKSSSGKSATDNGILTPPGSDTKKASRTPVSDYAEAGHIDIVTPVGGASPLLESDDSPESAGHNAKTPVTLTPKASLTSRMEMTSVSPEDCSPGSVRTSQRTRKRKQFYPIEGYIQPAAKRSRREGEHHNISKNG